MTLSRRHLLALSAASLATPGLAQGLSRPDIIIGWTPWSDAEVVTKLAARVLRERMGADVELTLADIEAQFRTLAKGDIDVMLMSWEPDLHAPYLRRYGEDLVDLGMLYQGTIGLAVPGWVGPEQIAGIPDLTRPDMAEALASTITGIDPGAGLMATTKAAMERYGLSGWTLAEGTGPSMVRQIARAERSGEPIVVTAWRPHAKFALYEMRYLDDPEGVFSGISQIHARASRDFVDRKPELAAVIRAMSFEISDIEEMMAAARTDGIDAAIEGWMAAHSDRIDAWLDAG